MGAAIGWEARTKHAHLLLTPTLNLHRHPLAGRNFECFSEDPELQRLGVAYIDGVQSTGVGCTAKHYVANESEFERYTLSSEVSARALRELCLRPFEAAVREADVWSITTACNRLNGVSCSENRELLTEILRNEWGFDGLVMSDWFGVYDTVGPALAGLDLEMPGPARFFGPALADAVARGEVPATLVEDMVRRLTRVTVRACATTRFAVVARAPQPQYCRFEWRQERPLRSSAHWRRSNAALRWRTTVGAATSGSHEFGTYAAGHVRMWLDGELIVDTTSTARVGETFYGFGSSEFRHETSLSAGSVHELVVEFRPTPPTVQRGLRVGSASAPPDDLIDRATGIARGADATLVFVGLTAQWESEGSDRASFHLPGRQAELIDAVGSCPRSAVVLNTGSPVSLSFAADVPALVQAWYPGMEYGNALVDVLTGVTNPSGRLPEDLSSTARGPSRVPELPRRVRPRGLRRGHLRRISPAPPRVIFPFRASVIVTDGTVTGLERGGST